MSDGKILINTKINEDGVKDGVKDINKKLGKVADKAGNVSKSMKKNFLKSIKKIKSKMGDIGKKAKSVGGSLTKYLTIPFTAIAGAAVHAALEVDRAQSHIQTALGATSKEAKDLTKVATGIYKQGFGESMGQISDAVVKVTNRMGKLNKQDLGTVIKGALTLSKTFGADINDTTKTAKTLMDNFKISGTKAFDLMTVGFQNGGDYAGDLLDTLNEYAPQFSALGLSAKDAMNILIAGADAGAFNLDKVADAVKEFGIRAQDGSKNTKEGFQAIGLSAEKMAKKIAQGGPAAKQAFQTTLVALASIEDPLKRNRAGVKLFGTQWEDLKGKVVTAMAGARDELGKVEGATKQATKTSKTQGQQFKAVWRKAKGALKPLGDILLEMANNWLPKIAGAIKTVAKWFKNMSPATRTFLIIFGAIVAMIGPALVLFGALVSVIGTLAAAEWAVIGPILLWVAAIAAAIAIIVIITVIVVKNWDKIKAFTIKIWNMIKDFFIAMWKWMKQAFKSSVDWVVNAVKTAWDWIKTKTIAVWNGIKKFFLNLWKWYIGFIKLELKIAKKVIMAVWNFIKKVTTTVWNGIKAFFKTTWKWIVKIVKTEIKIAKNIIKSVWNFIKNTTEAIWNSIKELIRTVWKFIKDKIVGTANDILDKIIEWVNDIKDKFEDMISGIKKALSKVYDIISSPFKKAWEFIKDIPSKIMRMFNSIRIDLPIPSFDFGVGHFNMPGPIPDIPYPTVDIDWHAKGAVYSNPSIVGVGDAGPGNPEVIAPEKMLKDTFDDVLDRRGINNNGNNVAYAILKLDRHEAKGIIEYITEEQESNDDRLDRSGGDV